MKKNVLVLHGASPVNYAAAIADCHGIPIAQKCTEEFREEIRQKLLDPAYPGIAEEYDGLLLCGGADLHPRYYGEDIAGSEDINEIRDECEMTVLDQFVRAGKPVLGICRGHQLINVYFGGSLIQDLPTRDRHTHDDRDLAHAVDAVPDSILAPLYGTHFVTNSAHHQAVGRLGSGLRITAVSSEDQVVEAFEHTSLPILGVQWHPERMMLAHARPDTVSGTPLIEYFLTLLAR